MDESAVKAIFKTAVAASRLSDDYAVVDKDQKLESLERFKTFPNQFRATFSTTLVEEFIAYINLHGNPKSALFIDHILGKALAIFDLGDPELPQWGKHRAELNLRLMPEYQTILQKQDSVFDQTSLITFVEDYFDHITFFLGDEDTTDTATQLTRLRRLKLDKTQSSESSLGNYATSRSIADAVEVKVAGTEPPPDGFHFTCVPYEGFDTVSLVCRLRIMPLPDGVHFKYRIIGRDKIERKVAGELLKKLENGIRGKELAKFIGTYQYQNV